MFRHSCAILPILLWKPKGSRPVQIGSAVLLQVGRQPVLLTAAHVTDLHREGKLCLHGSLGATEFAGSIGANLLEPGQLRAKDPIDIGYLVPLQDDCSELPPEYVPIGLADMDLNTRICGGDFCLIAGFPSSRHWAKYNGKELVGTRLNFVGVAYPHEEYAVRGYDPQINILIEHQIDNPIYPEGDRAYPPSPRGLSGGGVFLLGTDESGKPDSSRAKLVGIMHQFSEQKNMFVATTIQAALKLFVDSLPPALRLRVAT